VMFVGMFTAFFLSHRRYWARLQPVDPAAVDGPVELVVAGAARRHQYAFDEEFAKIRELLELAFGQGESVADRARALRAARQRRGGASVDAGLEEQRSPPESTGGATTGKTTDQHQRGDAPPDATTTTSGKVGA